MYKANPLSWNPGGSSLTAGDESEWIHLSFTIRGLYHKFIQISFTYLIRLWQALPWTRCYIIFPALLTLA